MPFTTIYGDGNGTRVIGDGTSIEQALHPTVMNYIAEMRSPTGGNYAMSVNEIDAVNNMVQAMVANGIWSKMKAVYPVIGGTAAAHKYNLVDPRDNNAAYRLVFSGGWTHSSTGMLPNGTNGYADTFLAGNVLSRNSTHLSYYSRSNTAGGTGITKVEMGYAALGVVSCNLIIKRLNVTFAGAINTLTFNGQTTSLTDTRGFFIGNRNSATVHSLYRNGELFISGNDNSVNPTSALTIWIGARNQGPTNYTDRQCAFASIGDGLTEEEARAFSAIVQAYQQKLGRAV